jgi:hypothetical protein
MFRTNKFTILLVLVAACAVAQTNPDSVKHRDDCRLAAQVLSHGRPAPRYEWALQMAWRCPEAASALGEEMEKMATVRDTAVLNALTQPTIQLRDGRLFDTALRVASDKHASTEARIFAIRTLIYTMRPGGGIDYRDLAERDRSCYGFGPSQHQTITQGAPVPTDYVARANAVGRQLAADTTEPDAVRHAGMCAALAREQILQH